MWIEDSHIDRKWETAVTEIFIFDSAWPVPKRYLYGSELNGMVIHNIKNPQNDIFICISKQILIQTNLYTTCLERISALVPVWESFHLINADVGTIQHSKMRFQISSNKNLAVCIFHFLYFFYIWRVTQEAFFQNLKTNFVNSFFSVPGVNYKAANEALKTIRRYQKN